MAEREAFMRSICEEPEDDTRKLVFADWLDENAADISCECEGGSVDSGEVTPWGEPIETACGICDGTGLLWEADWSRQWSEAIRWNGTITFVGSQFTHSDSGPVPARILSIMLRMIDLFTFDGIELTVRRGFICGMRCSTSTFLYHANEFCNFPITDVALTDREPREYFRNNGNYWRWFSSGEDSESPIVSNPAIIPHVLWKQYHSIYATPDAVPVWEFESEAIAQHVLSRSCVNYGRSLAGLPPLRISPNLPATST